MFLSQKLKLETLQNSRLPDDILETLDSKPIKKNKEARNLAVQENQDNTAECLSGMAFIPTVNYMR